MTRPQVQEVTARQLAAVLRGLTVRRIIAWLVGHHCYRPTAAQFRGRSTIWGVTRYHVGVRGWSDNGYHIMIGPDGSIWLCRPMRRSGGHCRARNADSIGISLVLDGDRERFWGTPQHRAFVLVLGMVAARFGIDPRTHFGPHSRWRNKTCPGLPITRQWGRLVKEVLAFMAGSVGRDLQVFVDGTELECGARLEGSRTRCNLREIVERLGAKLDLSAWADGIVKLRSRQPP